MWFHFIPQHLINKFTASTVCSQIGPMRITSDKHTLSFFMRVTGIYPLRGISSIQFLSTRHCNFCIPESAAVTNEHTKLTSPGKPQPHINIKNTRGVGSVISHQQSTRLNKDKNIAGTYFTFPEEMMSRLFTARVKY